MTTRDDHPPDASPPDSPHGALPLDALAAGELDPAAAQALRERLAADPQAAALFDQAREVERLLCAEPLLPLPLALVGRILEAARPARARPHVLLARVAACALFFFASWVAVSGDIPQLADVVTAHPRLVASLEDTALPAAPRVGDVISATRLEEAEPSVAGVVWASLVGVLLLVGGVAFGLLSHRAASESGPGSEPEGDES